MFSYKFCQKTQRFGKKTVELKIELFCPNLTKFVQAWTLFEKMNSK